jgi:hypothetical protein
MLLKLKISSIIMEKTFIMEDGWIACLQNSTNNMIAMCYKNRHIEERQEDLYKMFTRVISG